MEKLCPSVSHLSLVGCSATSDIHGLELGADNPAKHTHTHIDFCPTFIAWGFWGILPGIAERCMMFGFGRGRVFPKS
eukprot:371880-Amphidinium_carterae.1